MSLRRIYHATDTSNSNPAGTTINRVASGEDEDVSFNSLKSDSSKSEVSKCPSKSPRSTAEIAKAVLQQNQDRKRKRNDLGKGVMVLQLPKDGI